MSFNHRIVYDQERTSKTPLSKTKKGCKKQSRDWTLYHDNFKLPVKNFLCCSPLLLAREAAPFYGMEPHRGEDGSPIFDSLDVDLFVKVLANTAFSKT